MTTFKEIFQELEGSKVLQVRLHQESYRPETLYGITIVTTDGYEVSIYNAGQDIEISDNTEEGEE